MTALRETLPGCLADFARTRGDAVALREKKLGIWQEVSWRQYHEHVRASARMLYELGVRPGDCVAILSDNCPEWLYADLGTQSIGARAVGIYQTNPPPDVAYVLNDSRSKVLFCEDQEQVDKAVAIADDTPSVEKIVVFDPRGTRDIDDSRLMAYADFIERGRALDDPAWYDARLAELDPKAPSMVVYTSGTTGDPKGAMLSSYNVLQSTPQFIERAKVSSKDTVLSYLPLCHVAEKIFSVFIPLCGGCVVHFGESIETVQQDLREVSPTLFLGVPRIWEKMHSSVIVKMNDSSWLKRTLFNFFTNKGIEIGRRRLAGESTIADRVVFFVGDKLVYRPLQERLGLRNCWLPGAGAAPISPELLAWYHGIGVRICEGYGQTEGTGVASFNMPDEIKLGSVGKPAAGTTCKLADDGEILVTGPAVFCGYLNNPEATAEAIRDGWLYTGDIGDIDDDGYLYITGRKKEIIITSGGKNLSPEKIENALKTSPYIKEAIAIGDSRKFIAALVQIEYDTVSDWAQRRKLPHTSFSDLSAKPEVDKLIQDEIHKSNELLARVEQVRKFKLLAKELHQDDGELTATQKVRRRAIHEKYGELIEQMYGGGH